MSNGVFFTSKDIAVCTQQGWLASVGETRYEYTAPMNWKVHQATFTVDDIVYPTGDLTSSKAGFSYNSATGTENIIGRFVIWSG